MRTTVEIKRMLTDDLQDLARDLSQDRGLEGTHDEVVRKIAGHLDTAWRRAMRRAVGRVPDPSAVAGPGAQGTTPHPDIERFLESTRGGTETNDDVWATYRQELLAQMPDFSREFGNVKKQRPATGDWIIGVCPLCHNLGLTFAYHRWTGQWKCYAGCGEGDYPDYLAMLTRRPMRLAMLSLGDKMGLPHPVVHAVRRAGGGSLQPSPARRGSQRPIPGPHAEVSGPSADHGLDGHQSHSHGDEDVRTRRHGD